MRRITALPLIVLGLAIACVTGAQAASPFRYPAQRKPAAPATTAPVVPPAMLACLLHTALTRLVIE